MKRRVNPLRNNQRAVCVDVCACVSVLMGVSECFDVCASVSVLMGVCADVRACISVRVKRIRRYVSTIHLYIQCRVDGGTLPTF